MPVMLLPSHHAHHNHVDDDLAALIDSERARTGESFSSTVDRLLRRSARASTPRIPSTLPELPGRQLVRMSDVSELLAALDDERRAHRRVA
jgi:hypothetical protein